MQSRKEPKRWLRTVQKQKRIPTTADIISRLVFTDLGVKACEGWVLRMEVGGRQVDGGSLGVNLPADQIIQVHSLSILNTQRSN